MATNREIYINKLSDRDLGILLSNECYIGPDGKIKIEHINRKINSDSIEIYKWLSQEEDKDIKISPSWKDIKPLIETDKNLGFIMREIQKINDRLDRLEKYSLIGRDLILTESKTQNVKEDTIHDIKTFDGHSCGEIETKTASQMFEDLGYREIKSEYFDIEFIKYTVGTRIKIGIKLVFDGYIYEKSFEDPNCAHDVSEQIIEAEDIAIHKKIEELKNERHYK